jgi:hypothetical protein
MINLISDLNNAPHLAYSGEGSYQLPITERGVVTTSVVACHPVATSLNLHKLDARLLFLS